jgi:hypothetical protein
MTKRQSAPLSIDSSGTFPSSLPARFLKSGLAGGAPSQLKMEMWAPLPYFK